MEEPRWEGDLAKQYPFTLDPFQSTAIACIERRESVLVAAHTSGATLAASRHPHAALGSACRVCWVVTGCGRVWMP
jgi:hypothetical protein